MRIGMQTWGSDGDVRPMLALAGGLRAAGHDVRIAVSSVTGTDYSALASVLDFEIRVAGRLGYSDAELQRDMTRSLAARTFVGQFKVVMERLLDPIIDEMAKAADELCEDSELVIGHCIAYPLAVSAEKAGRRRVSIQYTPSMVPTAHGPIEGMPNLGSLLNPLGWKLGAAVIDRLLLPRLNPLRQRYGLGPTTGFLNSVMASDTLNLIAASPALCPRFPDWHERHQVCGFLNVPEHGESAGLSADLEQFLQDGPPPVFMTFGSMLLVDPEFVRITEIFVEAARLAGVRAIIQSKWDQIDTIPDNKSIHRVIRVAHQHIFPRCAAVVHHCGAGTAQSATLAGRPSITAPYYLDQGYWAKCLKQAGVAPDSLQRRTLTAPALAEKIREVVGSPQMKSKAESLGKTLRAENGVARAVELIGRIGASRNG